MEKITMLGASNSGKTCFIYAMYDFMQKPQNGFTFITNDPDVDMDLIEGWDSIAFDGIWPNGTQQTSYYDFTVSFKSAPIMEFSWCDYRGGAITDRSTQNDVDELHQRIFDSECLIVCIGADTIQEILLESNQYGRESRKGLELKRLNNLILRFAVKTQRRIPIIFTLTKADLYTAQEQRQLLSVIEKYFSALYEEGAGWLFAVVPVTLGQFEKNSEGDNNIRGVVAPKNIHVPVMFFLHSILKERIRNIQNRLRGISTDKNRYRQEIEHNNGRTWWDKFWNGDNTEVIGSKIGELNKEEQNISSQLKDLEIAFGNMKDMFDVCKIFYEGKPMTF